ncbi:hypothetical protein CR513_31494, partial [Mucuna pruriens]
MLPIPIIASKSSNLKCFKCLGKGHIAYQCPNKRSMIMVNLGHSSQGHVVLVFPRSIDTSDGFNGKGWSQLATSGSCSVQPKENNEHERRYPSVYAVKIDESVPPSQSISSNSTQLELCPTFTRA